MSKQMPQAIDLEKAVLGAILLEHKALYMVSDKLNSGAFYKQSHQNIYRAIKKIDREGGNIDILTVTEKLKDEGLLGESGGPSYVSELVSKVATSAHIDHHAYII
ncbi:MAG: DnaB-like helicase N-terminal domain-containing protein, partial [Bacteroidales bacterium]